MFFIRSLTARAVRMLRGAGTQARAEDSVRAFGDPLTAPYPHDTAHPDTH